MKTIAGIILVVLGALSLAYHGITYTHKEHSVDIGPIHASTEEKKEIPVPPVLGGIALAGGVLLVVMGVRQMR